MVRQAERSAATIEAVLTAARKLFMTRGFEPVSIDDIAEAAGIRKGGVYHHFTSKQAIFEAVLDRVQAELAEALEARLASNTGKRTPGTIASNVLAYLEAASAPGLRRIILIDGPVVLGWTRWREIDDRYFFASIHSGIVAIMAGASQEQVDCAAQLVAGAVMDAALAVGRSKSPRALARTYCDMLKRMLEGLQPTV